MTSKTLYALSVFATLAFVSFGSNAFAQARSSITSYPGIKNGRMIYISPDRSTPKAFAEAYLTTSLNCSLFSPCPKFEAMDGYSPESNLGAVCKAVGKGKYVSHTEVKGAHAFGTVVTIDESGREIGRKQKELLTFNFTDGSEIQFYDFSLDTIIASITCLDLE